MVFDEIGEIVEMFKGSFPLSFLFFVPILILLSPVNSAQDFNVYRMQQFDLQGSSFGCKNSIINMEARSIDNKMLTRRCAVVRLQDITMPKYRDLMAQSAGALLVLLPTNMTDLSPDDKQHLQRLEEELLQEPTTVPVYFAHETESVSQIYRDVQDGMSGDNAATAWEALLRSATANGFQLVISGSQAESQPDFEISNIQGRLSGFGIEEQLPTIVVTAHYDAGGIAPALAYGADSNASGVIILLELIRLFSKLYTNSRTHAKYNLVFLLSGGGKFNYQGSKRWIEDNVEAAEGNLLSDVAFAMCLDTLGDGDKVNLHVSKPPKEDSMGGQFYKHLEDTSKAHHPDVKVGMIHKKINLADEMLAWEHERFSIKRMLAFTLSHLDSHKDGNRASILDTRNGAKAAVIARNTQIIAESLAKLVYNVTSQGDFQMFTEALAVDEALVESWLNYLSTKPRAAQLLKSNSETIITLEQTMSRYLKDVRKMPVKADKRDPEFVFYTGAEYTMNAYSVKPAVFDLFLAIGIAAYLAVSYFIAQGGLSCIENNCPTSQSQEESLLMSLDDSNNKTKGNWGWKQ